VLFVAHIFQADGLLKAVASLAKGGGRHSATTMAISCLQDRDRDIRCEALDACQAFVKAFAGSRLQKELFTTCKS